MREEQQGQAHSTSSGQAHSTSSGQAHSTSSGQAMIMLVVVTIVLVSITTAAVAMVTTNLLSTMREEHGGKALDIAESGAENALLRLLRNPNYGGETVGIGVGSAVITVTGDAVNKSIESVGSVYGFEKTVLVESRFEDGNLVVDSWKEQ